MNLSGALQLVILQYELFRGFSFTMEFYNINFSVFFFQYGVKQYVRTWYHVFI